MSFGILDSVLEINEKNGGDCTSNDWSKMGWCAGKDKAYMLETAGMATSLPSAINSVRGMSYAAYLKATKNMRSAQGSTNFFGLLKNGNDTVDSSIVRFTQDSIGSSFKNGQPVSEMTTQLVS